MRFLLGFDGNVTLSAREVPDSIVVMKIIAQMSEFFHPELHDKNKHVAFEYLLGVCLIGPKANWQTSMLAGRRGSDYKYWSSHRSLRLKLDSIAAFDSCEFKTTKLVVKGVVGVFSFGRDGLLIDGGGTGALAAYKLTLDIVALEVWALPDGTQYPSSVYEHMEDVISTYIRSRE